MPIPDSRNAIAEQAKVRDYLLNADHPDGGAKAAWFFDRGYSTDQWQVLAEDLLEIARICDDFDTETSSYGVKYIASGQVGLSGHSAGAVLTVWIVEDGAPPRLVTAYPEH